MNTVYRYAFAAMLLSLSCLSFAQSSTPESTAPAPTDAQLDVMQQQMDTMQAQMQQMRNAKTPEERQAAMQAHMQSMQAHMQSMRQMGCCQGTQSSGHGMMGDQMHGGMMDGSPQQ